MPDPIPLPISTVIIASNEAHNLPRCLASVRGWTSEIIVALNNTSDDSEAIARSFGAIVYHLPWQGYRDTKNAALAHAKQPWVLAIDADEEAPPTLIAEIKSLFNADGINLLSGVEMPRRVWFMGRWITHGDWYPDCSLRLFRRDKARWGGEAEVHEKIICEGKVITLNNALNHYSFPSLAVLMQKTVTYADLFAEKRAKAGVGFKASDAVLRPIWRFMRAYFIKLGFLDGFPGFFIAAATAFGVLLRYTRLYEFKFPWK